MRPYRGAAVFTDFNIGASWIAPDMIACQAPLEHTLGDMLYLIHATNSELIIKIVNDDIPGQKPASKEYLPPKEGEMMDFPTNTPTVPKMHVGLDTIIPIWKDQASTAPEKPRLELRKFSTWTASDANQQPINRKTHYRLHLINWEDRGIVSHQMQFALYTAIEYLKIHILSQPINHEHPMIIHCSAGVGRTGSCAINTQRLIPTMLNPAQQNQLDTPEKAELYLREQTLLMRGAIPQKLDGYSLSNPIGTKNTYYYLEATLAGSPTYKVIVDESKNPCKAINGDYLVVNEALANPRTERTAPHYGRTNMIQTPVQYTDALDMMIWMAEQQREGSTHLKGIQSAIHDVLANSHN